MKVEMATDFVESNNNRRAAVKNSASAGGQGQGQGQGQEQEQLPCPRCDSINTKFCYYNNYNFSQPRHFCKACRRYWTQGGTLRDIPVGGGTRKNAKRSRTGHITTTGVGGAAVTSSSAASSVNMGQDYPLHATPVLMPFQGSTGQFCGGDVKGNNGNVGLCGSGGFTSLLSNQGPSFLALGGFGLGLGSSFVGDVGLGGLGRGVWGFAGMGDGSGVGSNGNGSGSGSGSGGATGIGNTWQFEGGETTATGFVGGDCFSWPDLAISTPGNGLK